MSSIYIYIYIYRFWWEAGNRRRRGWRRRPARVKEGSDDHDLWRAAGHAADRRHADVIVMSAALRERGLLEQCRPATTGLTHKSAWCSDSCFPLASSSLCQLHEGGHEQQWGYRDGCVACVLDSSSKSGCAARLHRLAGAADRLIEVYIYYLYQL